MADAPTSGDRRTRSIEVLAEEARSCTNCDLYAKATQVVFGTGPSDAEVVVVGEQPGDREDVEGEPFVGPAGQLLDRALQEAGVDRSSLYLTNAVKHFRWEPRGKRRIHKAPDRGQIAACFPWLEAELQAVEPRLVVALGAVAAQALTGPKTRVTRDRGSILRPMASPPVLVTVHPSSVLRSDDRDAAFAALVDDLRQVSSFLATA